MDTAMKNILLNSALVFALTVILGAYVYVNAYAPEKEWECLKKANVTTIYYTNRTPIVLIDGTYLSPNSPFYPSDACQSWIKKESVGSYNYSWVKNFSHIARCTVEQMCVIEGRGCDNENCTEKRMSSETEILFDENITW